MGVALHPHLEGPLAPIRSEDDFELRITGRIPEALQGTFYRNGPNPQFDPTGAYHAFIGDGMLHAFFLADGRARYRNRWVRTPRWRAENAAGRPLFGNMGMPHDPSVAGIPSGTANTHIVWHAGKLLALQEQSEPFAIDPVSLDALGFLETGGKFTAHPKRDPASGELVWFGYSVGEKVLNDLIDYGVTDASGRVTRRERFAAPYCAMVHDFMVTERHVLFPVLPLTGDLERAKTGRPAYAWEPEKGAFIGVMERSASVDTLRWFEIEPAYVFHPMNAWEEGERIHCELMEYPTPPLFPRTDGTLGPYTPARLTRWTLDVGSASQTAKREPLDDLAGEFPRFDERRAGLPYRHGWYGANLDAQSPFNLDRVVHLDLRTGKRSVRTFASGDSVGEPVFVPRAPDAAEGDGYVLVLVHRAADDVSDLLILHAQDIAGEPAAALHVPRRIPAGFHGSWVPAR